MLASFLLEFHEFLKYQLYDLSRLTRALSQGTYTHDTYSKRLPSLGLREGGRHMPCVATLRDQRPFSLAHQGCLGRSPGAWHDFTEHWRVELPTDTSQVSWCPLPGLHLGPWLHICPHRNTHTHTKQTVYSGAGLRAVCSGKADAGVGSWAGPPPAKSGAWGELQGLLVSTGPSGEPLAALP